MEPQKRNGAHRKRVVRTYGVKRSKATRPTDIVGVSFRMTEAIRERLVESAQHRGVSLNAEISHRIHQSFFLEDLLKARLISMRVPAGKAES